MELLSKKEIDKTLDILEKMFPNAKAELNYSSPFELLVAVILSAQCTDKRVNEVTSKLFKVANTPESFAKMNIKTLEKYIYSCGFYVNKAKHIKEASKEIVSKYNGEVPNTIDKLMTLPGVGKKTANVVGSVAFGIPAIAVDTHVFRVSKRLGMAKGNMPLKVEEELESNIKKERWNKSHHLLIFLGRYMCHSIKPNCENCKLNKICKHIGVKNV